MLVPPIVDLAAVQETSELISGAYGVPTQWKQLDTMESYKQILAIQLVKDQGIDIALVPTQWIDSFADW
ncbi:MAG: hypothetical protein H6765_03250 [Candidatus Peribacteria bacterium]|nr:MAG: hypothetical protein H6765_03250 [Candidatus Peribacteria bacterium]